MSRIVSVKLREQEFDVCIDHDGGYEHDTGAHDIDWHFIDKPDGPDLTHEEESEILDQLCALEPPYFEDDVL